MIFLDGILIVRLYVGRRMGARVGWLGEAAEGSDRDAEGEDSEQRDETTASARDRGQAALFMPAPATAPQTSWPR